MCSLQEYDDKKIHNSERRSFMHKSSFLRMGRLIKYYEPFFHKSNGKINVLDIGSYDVNGTYREILDVSQYCYTGLDMEPGKNVDIVPKDIYHWNEISDQSFDLVISGQVFEHIEYPWLTIREIARVLKPSGFCIIIAPNAGTEHKAPKDCYRYFADGLAALAKWADLKVHHTSVGGMPETENPWEWMNDWNDGCMVAQKEPSESTLTVNPFTQERRVPTYGYFDTCRIWETTVRKVCEKYKDKRPFVLFGAGWIGDMVLDILGKRNVDFFIDNSPDKIGKKFRGKRIISFHEYLDVCDRYNCLITASYNASILIKQQMEEKGVIGEILY